MKPLLPAILAASLTPLTAAAQSTWTGALAGNPNWGQAGNWDAAPTFGATADLIFHNPGAAQLNPTSLGAARTVNSITFNASADTIIGVRLTNADGSAGAQLTFDGAGAGLIIDPDAAATITFGSTAFGTMRIGTGATFSGTGNGIDINHQGTGELVFARELQQQSAGASILKSGSGTWTIAANNKITGTFHLAQGRVNFHTNTAGGDPGVTWIIEPGVTIGNESAATVDLAAADPAVTINGDFTYASAAGREFNFGDGPLTLTANAAISVTAATLLVDGTLGESGGSFALTKQGAGALRLRSPATYSGSTTIEAGTLELGEDGANSGAPGPGPIVNNALFRIRGNANPKTIAQNIAGIGNLEKIDNAPLTLAGTNTYSGTTTVTTGSLTLTGSHSGAGPYSVAAGATLAGHGGATDGSLTVAAGGKLDPGKAGLTLDGAINNLSGATYLLEIDGDAAGQFDTLAFSGSLTLGDAILDTTGSTIAHGSVTPLTILNGTTEAVTGTFAGLPDGAVFVIGTQAYQIDYTGGGDGFDVVLTPLPDPVVTIAANSADTVEGGSASFTLSAAPPPSGGNITAILAYSGTAANGADFTGQASIDILDGNPTAVLTLPTTNDGVLEGPESLTVSISGFSGLTAYLGTPGTATLQLLDANSAPAGGAPLAQTIIGATAPVALGDIVASDEAGGSSRIAGVGVPPAFVYNGLANRTTFGAGFSATASADNFTLTPNPNEAAGFSLDLEFTPAAPDVAGGSNYRSVWEIGGGSNGCGIYLLNGVPHFIAKMSGADGDAPGGLTDTDWIGNTVCVPLTAAPLVANQRLRIALVFTLDSVTFSVDGAAPTTQPLVNRTTQTNWRGTPNVSIGSIDAAGSRGGLSTAAGVFLRTSYTGLTNAPTAGAVTTCRFWNATSGSITTATGSPETITATLTIRDWATHGGSLSTTGGGSFSNGIWSATGDLATVNAALAAVEFTPGTADPAVIDVTLDDQTSAGTTTGAIIVATARPVLAYVDDSFTPAWGAVIPDADLGTAGNQGALLGHDAFTTLAGALTAVDPAGTILVNDGNYSAETPSLANTLTLRLANTTGGVTIGSLEAETGNAIDLQTNTLTLGNNSTDNTIRCPITGAGNLTKAGTDRLTLWQVCTYTGTTTVNGGFLRVGLNTGLGLQAELAGDGPVVVNSPGALEFNIDTDKTVTQTGPISGDGRVLTLSNGTLVFDGPAANTFSGGFDLGDGASSTWTGTAGVKEGFVVIGRSDHLGTGPISARGSQLQASAPGLVIPNNITLLAGGLRLGGSNDFALSGTIVPDGALRGIGNYGLDGRTFTVSGTIDLDGSGLTWNLNFDGANNENNGDFLVTATITGSGTLGLNGDFDNGVVSLAGTNTCTGPTNVNSGTLLVTGTHTGGGPYSVNSGATLGGTGSLDSIVNLNAGATLAPGTSIGALQIELGTIFDAAATFRVEINSSPPTPAADLLDSNWDVNLGSATLAVTDVATTPAVLPLGTKLTLIDYSATGSILTGEFAGLPDGATVIAGANRFTIDYNDDATPSTVTLTAAGPASAYQTWVATNHPGLSGGFDDDPDADGTPSGLEWYFFNSNPTTPDAHSSPLSATTATGPGTFTFTHLRPVDRTGLTETYRWSANLSTWFASGASDGTTTVTLIPGAPTPATPGYESVTVTVTATGAIPPKVFGRLELSN